MAISTFKNRAPCALLTVALLAAGAAELRAEPLRLRGDALAAAESPVGLLAFEARGQVHEWMSAEAVVWAGSSDQDSSGDALVVVVRVRDPKRRGEAKLGRFVAAVGALRPLHLDGLWGVGRLPYAMKVEAFGGVPVVPEFGADGFDWVAGTRISRAIGAWGSAGIAYMHRRDSGELADEELGLDAGMAVNSWLDLGGRASMDLIMSGLSEAHLSASASYRAWRFTAFGLHRSPSRILPATSLFSVLGDVPSQRVGGSARWRAAPRLDVDASMALRRIDDAYGESLSARSTLRLDERGTRAVSVQLRRESAPDADWTGLRVAGRWPMQNRLTLALEGELAVPDLANGRGRVWPWGLLALRWLVRPQWTLAGAVEASASPELRRRVDVLLRLARAWELP